MKRGLVVLDHSEIAAEEWTRRVRELRARICAEGVDIAFVYGDVHRSDDIGYLTNLCIYWNEGVLAVPADGEPVFLTKLSPRVHRWMRKTSMVSELRSGRAFGSLAQELLRDEAPGVLGLVDARRWPMAVVDELTAALPAWELRLLGDLVRDQRVVPSAAELALLRDGGRIVGRAADRAGVPGLATAARVALVESELRGAGFADVRITSATADDGLVSIEITGQYRHGWLRAARIVEGAGGVGGVGGAGEGDATWASVLRAGLAAAIDAASAGASAAAISAAAEPILDQMPRGATCFVDWINQADLSTNGEYERHARHTPLPAGTVGTVAVETLFAAGGRAVVADTVLVGAADTRRLTVLDEGVAV
jgi:creatinase/prolidase-like protein